MGLDPNNHDNKLRVYRFKVQHVAMMLAGIIPVVDVQNWFPDGCQFRGMKIDEEKLCVAVSHPTFKEATEEGLPTYDLSPEMEPVKPDAPKSSLLIL